MPTTEYSPVIGLFNCIICEKSNKLNPCSNENKLLKRERCPTSVCYTQWMQSENKLGDVSYKIIKRGCYDKKKLSSNNFNSFDNSDDSNYWAILDKCAIIIDFWVENSVFGRKFNFLVKNSVFWPKIRFLVKNSS